MEALLLQDLVNGISAGLCYALVAIGFTLIFGVLNAVNFAHGEIYMLGAFAASIARWRCAAAGRGCSARRRRRCVAGFWVGARRLPAVRRARDEAS